MVMHYNGGIEKGLVDYIVKSGDPTKADLDLQKELSFLPPNRSNINIGNLNIGVRRFCFCHDTYTLFRIYPEKIEKMEIEHIMKELSEENINPIAKYDNGQIELIYDQKRNKYVLGFSLYNAYCNLFFRFFS